MTDEQVFLLTGGNSNKRNSATWTGVDTDVVYGGNGDLWGSTTQTLNPATVNSPNFGVYFTVKFDGPKEIFSDTAYVDGYRITVYYTTP